MVPAGVEVAPAALVPAAVALAFVGFTALVAMLIRGRVSDAAKSDAG
jgi:hypothetical protein